jgi:hypothetical protein
VTDYYAKVIGQYATGRRWTTGLHITSNQTRDALATTWRNAILNMWTDPAHGIQTLYPVATSVESVEVVQLDGKLLGVSKTDLATVVPGTSTADTLPWQEATLISLRGTSIKKYGRGRMYLPALAEDQVNGNILIPAAQTRIKTAILAVFSAINADGSTVFTAPRNVKKPPKDGTPLYTKFVLTTPLVADKPARQSRRVDKVTSNYM